MLKILNSSLYDSPCIIISQLLPKSWELCTVHDAAFLLRHHRQRRKLVSSHRVSYYFHSNGG